MLLIGARVSVARLAAILGAAVVVVGAVATLDWLRPADQRTHLGRFVQQLIDGDAWTVVSRKAGANLGILTGSPLAWMLPVILVAAVWLVRPGGLLRGGRSGLAPRDAAVLRAGLLAVALGLVIGTAVNDSGVALPATAAGMLVPLLIWLAAAPRTTGPAASLGAGDHPGSGPVEDPDRVTVGSRGSTVWHA
jgi:tryptophan-rich sensory protein